MIRQLPKVEPPTDYDLLRGDVRRNHNHALVHLKEVRAMAAEFEKSGDQGAHQYRDRALAATNHKAVRDIDLGETYKAIKTEIFSNHDALMVHRINSKLDSLIAQMEHEKPIVPIAKGSGMTQNIHNIAQSQSSASVDIEINNILQGLERLAKEYEVGSQEKTFIEKLKDKIGKTKDLATILLYVAQAAETAKLSFETVAKILGRL